MPLSHLFKVYSQLAVTNLFHSLPTRRPNHACFPTRTVFLQICFLKADKLCKNALQIQQMTNFYGTNIYRPFRDQGPGPFTPSTPPPLLDGPYLTYTKSMHSVTTNWITWFHFYFEHSRNVKERHVCNDFSKTWGWCNESWAAEHTFENFRPNFRQTEKQAGPVKVRRRVCWTENILSSGLLSYHLFGLQFSW